MQDKVAWSDFKQALPGLKGEGQESVVMTETLVFICGLNLFIKSQLKPLLHLITQIM